MAELGEPGEAVSEVPADVGDCAGNHAAWDEPAPVPAVGEESSENPQAGTGPSSGSAAASAADGQAGEDGAFPADAAGELGHDTADVRATLTNVASGLAEQLSSITEEMNKIRQELYGETGLGGIATELERLKASGLGDLGLGSGELEELLGGKQPRQRSSEAPRTAGRRAGAGEAGAEARQRRSPNVREQELEELRRRLVDRRAARQAAQESGVSTSEKLLLLAIVMVILYICSPFFRTSVQKVATSLLFGAEGAEDFDTEF